MLYRYHMHKTVAISAILSATALLFVILVQTNAAEAALPVTKKIQKPVLTLYLSSPSGTVKNAVVKASIHNQLQTKTVTVSGIGYTPVTFTFTPVQRALIDWFDVSVKNPSTGELNSWPFVWWDKPGPSTGYLQVLNTR